jgi:hypothetical protein
MEQRCRSDIRTRSREQPRWGFALAYACGDEARQRLCYLKNVVCAILAMMRHLANTS